LIELLGFDDHVLAGSVLVAADDGGGVNGTMAGTVLGVAEALAALGMEQVGGGHIAGADGGIGLERDGDEAELQEARPTGSAGDRGSRRADRCGGRRGGSGLGEGQAHEVLRRQGTVGKASTGEALPRTQ
jgi:hypothetical protein